MTSDLAKLMRDHDYCHRKARTSMSRRSWAAFRKINREVHLSMKKAKTDYYWKLIEENKGNCSELWSSIKQVLPTTLSNSITSIQNNNVVYTTPQGIANALNDFFANIDKMFSQKFTSTRSPTSSLQQAESSFCFFEISQDLVTTELNRVKTNKSTGMDKISARLVKDTADIIAQSLTALLNTSIKESTFPTLWKTGKITALFKNGVKSDPSNYRPMCILPTLSKILEKAIHMQLYQNI